MSQVPAKSVISRERAAEAFFYRGLDVLDMYIEWNKDRLRLPTHMDGGTPFHPASHCWAAHGHAEPRIVDGTWVIWYPGTDLYLLMDPFTFDLTFRDADVPG